MAENVVAPTDHIREFIRDNEHQVEFFQLMRVIAAYLRGVEPSNPLDDFEQNDWDENFRKYVRINPSLSTAFPNRDISSIKINEKNQFLIETTFFGLYGVTSPLPNFYSEDISRLSSLGYNNARRFLDIFNHAAFPLLLKAITRFRSSTGLQEHLSPRQRSRKASWIGLATPAFMNRYNEWPRLLEISTVLSSPHPTASGLAAMLQVIVQSGKVTVHPCATAKMPIPAQNRWRLGFQASTLGDDAVVGQFVDDRRNQVGVEFEGQEHFDLQAILPGGCRYDLMKQAISLHIPRHLRLRFSMKTMSRSEPVNKSLLGFGATLGSKSELQTLTYYA
jgi:type VI secretion system protein ImpH